MVQGFLVGWVGMRRLTAVDCYPNGSNRARDRFSSADMSTPFSISSLRAGQGSHLDL